ncbi:endonuclease/exonuclease/phosphatase family protein [Celeribacter neptunius]|uniref:Metal-dependent hydrolase, endonuclease/exonuclease/phosphatase family n=1 Tax=Celeribacter neptunius TaxID=588602 RepID=A0A1I3QZL8_9RHOB|nr:endonuclease/exonuclease/phosphatase family protein [Celeribacter neptunius]SFJ38721.1 Metal-dependent hydrolase, endonuclease/exonuclease/phosphatase family [Celeribacter neptunius]
MISLLDRLPPVSAAQRETLLNAPRTAEAHREMMHDVLAMNAVQIGGSPVKRALPNEITVAAWNVERCLFPQATAAHLMPLKPDVVLLSEVDHGMARTGQRHTTAEVAHGLGMGYAFGVEFFEMGLGGPTERAFCAEKINAFGWHGNAVLSTVPFDKVTLIRLDDHGHWFASDSGASDPDQPRLGGRMAIAAVLPTEAGEICVTSTHLESNAGPAHRHTQFEHLLDALDEFAPGMPLLIGGDLNTGNHIPPNFNHRDETLFDLGTERGLDWGFTAEGMTTRPSLITPHPDRVMKLDWIAARGMSCRDKGILPSLDDSKRPLADHDCVWARAAF